MFYDIKLTLDTVKIGLKTVYMPNHAIYFNYVVVTRKIMVKKLDILTFINKFLWTN